MSIFEELMSEIKLTHVVLKSPKSDFLKNKDAVMFAETIEVPEVKMPPRSEESS